MFFKVLEWGVRLVYRKRFRAAETIGKATQWQAEGRASEALALLEELRPALHTTLLPLHRFALGHTLVSLGRWDEAEAAFAEAAQGDPKNPRPDIEAALLCARRGDHSACRTWLVRAIEKQDGVADERAAGFLQRLDQLENGELGTELTERGRQMSLRVLSDCDAPLGLSPDRDRLRAWAEAHPDEARELFDELALWLAWTEVQRGGRWVFRLFLEDTRVACADGRTCDPFAEAAELLLFDTPQRD
ncbi:MAG: hypothetical protein GX146_12790 [Myxococcales bacterium]|nr:hypothetical protein [Myxococcales bacterium]